MDSFLSVQATCVLVTSPFPSGFTAYSTGESYPVLKYTMPLPNTGRGTIEYPLSYRTRQISWPVLGSHEVITSLPGHTTCCWPLTVITSGVQNENAFFGLA